MTDTRARKFASVSRLILVHADSAQPCIWSIDGSARCT
jgi:hypothetical protein